MVFLHTPPPPLPEVFLYVLYNFLVFNFSLLDTSVFSILTASLRVYSEFHLYFILHVAYVCGF
jgi:hypothetical protein